MIISRGGDPLPVLGRFESVSGYTPPADYQDWMVQHNGGYLTADLPMPHPKSESVMVLVSPDWSTFASNI